MIDKQTIRTSEPLRNNRGEKRFDTSGRATIELIEELQKRSTPNTKSSTKNNA